MSASTWPAPVLLVLALAVPYIGSGYAQSTYPNNSNENTIANVFNELMENSNEQSASSPTSSGNVRANIIINEIELNPKGNDSGYEWIELYNPTGVDANISNFEITTSFKSMNMSLQPGAAISANGTYVVVLESEMLSDIAESIIMLDASGDVVDRTPSLVDTSDDDLTWQRMPDGNEEWQFAAATRDELNDPYEQAKLIRSDRPSPTQCQGTAGCAEGMAIRIVDADTLYIKINGTVYKTDLALTSAPSMAEDRFIESTMFTRGLCLGNKVLVDQDDQLLTSDTSIIALVYCESTNLNKELLDNDYAAINLGQCSSSEFSNQLWAKEHGC